MITSNLKGKKPKKRYRPPFSSAQKRIVEQMRNGYELIAQGNEFARIILKKGDYMQQIIYTTFKALEKGGYISMVPCKEPFAKSNKFQLTLTGQIVKLY